MPRLMNNSEIAGFLARHPVIAARVAVTKTAFAIGAYDINIYDTSAQWGVLVIQFPGIIPPRGIQVQDDTYGIVTIQPTGTGVIWYSAFSPRMGDVEKPDYQSPVTPTGTQTCFSSLENFLACLQSGAQSVLIVGVAAAVWYFYATKKKR